MAVSVRGDWAYTELLRSVSDDISAEFESFHSKEEACALCDRLTSLLKHKENGEPAPLYDEMYDVCEKLEKILTICDPVFASEKEEDDLLPDDEKRFPVMYSDDYKRQIIYELACFRDAAQRLPTAAELDMKLFSFLFDKYGEFRSSADYITRLVRMRLSVISPELLDDEAATGLLIMRQFIKQFGCGMLKMQDGTERPIEDHNKGKGQKNNNSYYSQTLRDMCLANYGGDYSAMSAALGEDEYLALTQAPDCNFAKIAQAFGEAFFSNQGKTREYIYIFAIAFEMRCPGIVSGKSDADDRWTDINRCLFFDFYTDNLINRRLSEREEKYIDGYGIGWKNYVEIIYLYYINRGDKTAAEKLYGALTGAYYCHESSCAKTAGELAAQHPDIYRRRTEFFRENFLTRLMNEKNEKDFLDAVTEIYECRLIGDEGHLRGLTEDYDRRIAAAKSDRRPFDEIEKLEAEQYLVDIGIKSKRQQEGLPVSLAASRYSSEKKTALAFYDCFRAAISGKVPDRIMNAAFDFSENESDEHMEIRYCGGKLIAGAACIEVTEDFIGCLRDFNDRYLVGCDHYDYKSETVICRSDLLSVCADYITDRYFNAPINGVADDFTSFFRFFCSEAVFRYTENGETEIFNGVNGILIKCGYQEITTKNIFDILIVFLTFKKCRMLAF